MISEDVQELLYNAIRIYDTLAENDYLIIGRKSLQYPIEYFPIRLKKEYFWHLLGCKAKTNSELLYNKCKSKEPIANLLDYANGSDVKKCKEKYDSFIKVFDFVKNAKEIRVCDTENTPDRFNFILAMGHFNGIIGYDRYTESDIYYPKSTQSKSLSEFNSKNTARKIIIIIKKKISETEYSLVVYENKKDILRSLAPEISERYKMVIDKKLMKSDL
ncbi:MAG: hypothetical protein K6E47_09110 [Lachnospiraceae bacterium]|nr:hypothetical protein [Lachnospiraceae bacterium]